jgi:hypothetical protein
MRSNAAGIDIGATEIYVAVPADRDAENVRSFPTFTQDLYRLADWLKKCGMETVAMESTGVYWIPLFQILEERGFEVCLVNARHGCFRLPVAAVPALRWSAARFLSSGTGSLRRAFPASVLVRSSAVQPPRCEWLPNRSITANQV